jgi:hypothetical protein
LIHPCRGVPNITGVSGTVTASLPSVDEACKLL